MFAKLGVCNESRVAYAVSNELCSFLGTSEMASNEHRRRKRSGNLFIFMSKPFTQCSGLTATQVRQPIAGAEPSNDFVNSYL